MYCHLALRGPAHQQNFGQLLLAVILKLPKAYCHENNPTLPSLYGDILKIEQYITFIIW
jgi:hypothetical protein